MIFSRRRVTFWLMGSVRTKMTFFLYSRAQCNVSVFTSYLLDEWKIIRYSFDWLGLFQGKMRQFQDVFCQENLVLGIQEFQPLSFLDIDVFVVKAKNRKKWKKCKKSEKLFFQTHVNFFLCIQWLYCRYPEGPLRLPLYIGNKIIIVRRIYRNLFTFLHPPKTPFFGGGR